MLDVDRVEIWPNMRCVETICVFCLVKFRSFGRSVYHQMCDNCVEDGLEELGFGLEDSGIASQELPKCDIQAGN
jgi:hypothetical protein